MKGSVLSAFLIGIALLGVFIFFMLMATLWLHIRPGLDNATTPQGASVINNIGNIFYLDGTDSILLFMYFTLVIGSFISDYYEAADVITLPVGLLLCIPIILVTMPLSDFAYAFATSPSMLSVAPYFKSTIYLLENLPIFTAIITLANLIFVVTKKSGGLPHGPQIISG